MATDHRDRAHKVGVLLIGMFEDAERFGSPDDNRKELEDGLELAGVPSLVVQFLMDNLPQT